MMTELQERVQRGVNLLDKYISDWRSKIDILKLDMNHCNNCVLGQLFGSYKNGLCAFRLGHGGAPYGFYSDEMYNSGDFSFNLTELWINEIKIEK